MANPFSALGDDSDDEGNTKRTSKTQISNRGKTNTKKVTNDKRGQRGGKARGTTTKREKDRHVSGTGRSKGTAKNGAGSRNWGTDKDELAGQQDAAKETAEGDEEAAPAEPEEPDNTVTYAEYMASQGGSKKQETASQVQEKPKIEAMFEVNKVKKVRKKKVKKVQTLQLAFKFDAQEDAAPKRDQNRGGDRGGNRGGDRGGNRGGDRGDRRGGNNRGGRGGRGGGRGGKGGNRQGGNRQGGNRGANFAAPNDSAFPTLA